MADNSRLKKEEEDLKMDDKIEIKFNLPEVETDDEDEIIEDNLNIEPENADEKLKQFEPYVKLKLETPKQIDYYEKLGRKKKMK